MGASGRLICFLLLLAVGGSAPLLGADGQRPSSWLTAQEAGGIISGLSASPDNDTVGVVTNLVIEFQVSGDSVSRGTQIQMVVPPEFDFSGIDSIGYADDDDLNTDYTIADYNIDGDLLLIELDTLGSAPVDGSTFDITYYGIVNAEEVGQYRVALALLTAEGGWLANPVWSPYFQLVAGPLSQFELYPKGVQSVQAGNVIHFYVETADQYGNDVVVGPAVWTVVGAPVVNGTIVNGDFQARKTGASRIVAAAGGLTDTSSLVYVLPGVFAYLSLEGGAAKAVAGHGWPDDDADVTVEAHDIFGNLIQDFEGEVYFECTDPLSTLPATEGEPYQFTGDDAGRHVFKGSGFTFITAGKQDLTLLYESEVQQILASITVVPDLAVDFEMDVPQSVVAGEIFTVAVAAAADKWGNATDGVVAIKVISGTSVSPSGATSALAPFLVVDGVGGTTISLVAANIVQLSFSLDSLAYVREIEVQPADLDHFDFELASLQVVGQPFFGPATLTALDRFDNIVTDYLADQNAITITSSGAGTVFNNTVNGFDSFVDGVCDLTEVGTGYTGTEFFVTFTATSQTGKSGVSPVVQFAAVKMTDARLESDTKYAGEEYNLLITITNFGSQITTVNDLRIYGNDALTQPISIAPVLPDEIEPASNETYSVTGTVPDLPGQTIDFSAAFSGHFGADAIKDSLGNVATLTILSSTGISVVSGTLTPTQVTTGRQYGFSLSVRNDSEDDLTLQTGTSLRLAGQDAAIVEMNLQSTTLVESSGQPVQLNFVPAVVPGSSPGEADANALHLLGTLGSISYDNEIPVTDAVLLQTPPAVTYQLGSFTPTTVYRGRDVTFSLGIVNNGTATMAVTGGELTLYAADRLLVTRLNDDIDVIHNGSNDLRFKSTFLPSDWPAEIDSLTLNITGSANNHSESIYQHLSGELITIPSGAAVGIAGTMLAAPNAPWVNVGQQFVISAVIENSGDEPLKDISVVLGSDGGSSFAGSLSISSLALDADTTVQFDVTSSLTANISELFTVNVTSATGANSGLPARILAPRNYTQIVAIQKPAALSLVAEVTSPAEAQDRIVEPETEFTISAVVLNSGQAATGSGKLKLQIIDDTFLTSDPLVQTFEIGDQITWVIEAPDHPDTGTFYITIDSLPNDLNWGTAAKAIDSEQYLDVAVREVQVEIGVDFTAPDSPLLAAGGTYEVLDLVFEVLGKAEKPYLTFIDVYFRNRAAGQVDPEAVIASAQMNFNGSHQITAQVLTDPYRLHFPLSAGYDLPERAVVTLNIAANPQVSDFTMYLDSNSFGAEYQSAVGLKDVPVKADFASLLVISKDFTLVSQVLDEAFFCYPNPFSPTKGELKFSHPRPGTHAVLSIFSLTGEEILTKEIPADVGQVFYWDGRNEAGNMVLNGVYLAVLTIDGEGEVRTKIAVVK